MTEKRMRDVFRGGNTGKHRPAREKWAPVVPVLLLQLLLLAIGGVTATPAYAAPGDLDTSFGIGGKVTTQGFSASAVAIQSDSNIVAAGQDDVSGDLALVRYTPTGGVDRRFGMADGKVTTDVIFGEGGESATDVAIQPEDGKIVAAGSF